MNAIQVAVVVAVWLMSRSGSVWAQESPDKESQKVKNLTEEVNQEQLQTPMNAGRASLETRLNSLETRLDQMQTDTASDLRVVWKNGFKIISRDKMFELIVGGRAHFDGRFRLGRNDPSTSTFDVRSVRIFTRGHLFEHYYWKVGVEFSRGRGRLRSGWLDFRYFDDIQLQVGQFKEPFGLEALTSGKYVKFSERSMATKFIAPAFGTGAMLHGSLLNTRLGYSIGILNGNGRNRTDENDDKDLAVRLNTKPLAASNDNLLKGIQFGGSLTVGNKKTTSIDGSGPTTQMGTRFFTFNSGVGRDGERIRQGLEAAWHVGPFGISGEYLKLKERLSNGGIGSASGSIRGWYGTALTAA
ncbi:MAG: hypothetical protein COB53_00610 [Elusimicrobia bacterium]|nr:MAG: hypothetical protein COB53_00610 [Elusimicrobiota bacterium]